MGGHMTRSWMPADTSGCWNGPIIRAVPLVWHTRQECMSMLHPKGYRTRVSLCTLFRGAALAMLVHGGRSPLPCLYRTIYIHACRVSTI